MSNILKKVLFIIVVLTLAVNVQPLFSQEKYAREYEQQGDKSMQKQEYSQALDYYVLGRKFVKKDLRLMFKCGEACLAMHDYDKAEYWYQKVLIENDTANINNNFPYLYLHLSRASISNGNIIQAQSFLNTCLLDCNDINVRKECKDELKRIDWIIDNDKEKNYTITNLGKNINDETSQMGTFILSDSILVFTTPEYKTKVSNGNTYYTDIYNQLYYSFIDEDYYTPAKKLEWGKINKKKTNCSDLFLDTATFTAYFTYTTTKKNRNNSQIYYSKFENHNWTKPMPFLPTFDKNSSNTHPVIARQKNEAIMYFASNRSGGFGQMDIWFVNLNDKSAKPINCGNTINTIGNEITPFYYVDDEELYFSSDKHYGFGGFDIFRSNGWQNRWTTPENLLTPINSPANDMYPFIIDSDNEGYFTSNRESTNNKHNKTCCNDLYRFNSNVPNEPTMQVIEKKDKFNPMFDLPLALYFHNDSPDAGSNSPKTNLSYEDCYKLYVSLSNQYKVNRTKGLDDSLGNIELSKIDTFFENKIKHSYEKLNDALEFIYTKLQEGKNVTVQIRGFASSLFETTYNFNLSERRIVSVENYMRAWRGGVLKTYMDSIAQDNQHKLEINHLAMGKLQSTSPNPETLEEKRHSIYLEQAMEERRIEIKVIQIRN
jgi:outer membrane protein OmpA-like peptidoglycan-associated protein